MDYDPLIIEQSKCESLERKVNQLEAQVKLLQLESKRSKDENTPKDNQYVKVVLEKATADSQLQITTLSEELATLNRSFESERNTLNKTIGDLLKKIDTLSSEHISTMSGVHTKITRIVALNNDLQRQIEEGKKREESLNGIVNEQRSALGIKRLEVERLGRVLEDERKGHAEILQMRNSSPMGEEVSNSGSSNEIITNLQAIIMDLREQLKEKEKL